ncbi:MAG: hypothetical protein LUI87_07515 [Lachnospiraceae bacterium]|nr:hypothetical protein [Lachnospiraceae bacterium]
MTDYNEVKAILNDFLSLYGNERLGIRRLYKKYGDSTLFLALMRDLNEAEKIPVKEAMLAVYSELKPYRAKNLLDKDWEEITKTASNIVKKYGDNRWLKHFILEMLDFLEADDLEIRRAAAAKNGEEKKAA